MLYPHRFVEDSGFWGAQEPSVVWRDSSRFFSKNPIEGRIREDLCRHKV